MTKIWEDPDHTLDFFYIILNRPIFKDLGFVTRIFENPEEEFILFRKRFKALLDTS